MPPVRVRAILGGMARHNLGDRKKVALEVPAATHARLKALSARTGASLNTLVCDALEKVYSDHPKAARSSDPEATILAKVDREARIDRLLDQGLVNALQGRPDAIASLDDRSLAQLAVSRAPKPREGQEAFEAEVAKLGESLAALEEPSEVRAAVRSLTAEREGLVLQNRMLAWHVSRLRKRLDRMYGREVVEASDAEARELHSAVKERVRGCVARGEVYDIEPVVPYQTTPPESLVKFVVRKGAKDEEVEVREEQGDAEVAEEEHREPGGEVGGAEGAGGGVPGGSVPAPGADGRSGVSVAVPDADDF